MLYTNIPEDVLVIGARNILYKLDAQEFRLTQTMRWPSKEAEVEKCHVKGKRLLECQNYIKVLQQYKVPTANSHIHTQYFLLMGHTVKGPVNCMVSLKTPNF